MQEADLMQETKYPYRGGEDPPAFDYDEYEDEEQEQDEDTEYEPEKPRGGLRLLTAVQVFGSIAVLVAALLLRTSGGDLFQKVRTWYLSAVNDSIIADEQIGQAKKTVVGLWDNIAAARPESAPSQSGASSKAAPASSKGSASGSPSGAVQQVVPSSAPAPGTGSVSP